MALSATIGVRRCRLAAVLTVLAALALLSGCGRGRNGCDADPAALRSRAAAEQGVRAIVPSGTKARFRGIQVYGQAMAKRFAVCGQVSPFDDDPNIFVPFVAVVADRPAGAQRLPQDQYEQHVATTTSEANRVYLATVEYCYDKGGPDAGPFRSVPPIPPLPDTVPDLSPAARAAVRPPAAHQAAPQPPPRPVPPPVPPRTPAAHPVPDHSPASGTVSMRRNGNLHAGPHGRDVRVVPKGAVLRIFSQAPGGWYEVGGSSPWGWVHESLLQRR
jgi:hypothetical protein